MDSSNQPTPSTGLQIRSSNKWQPAVQSPLVGTSTSQDSRNKSTRSLSPMFMAPNGTPQRADGRSEAIKELSQALNDNAGSQGSIVPGFGMLTPPFGRTPDYEPQFAGNNCAMCEEQPNLLQRLIKEHEEAKLKAQEQMEMAEKAKAEAEEKAQKFKKAMLEAQKKAKDAEEEAQKAVLEAKEEAQAFKDALFRESFESDTKSQQLQNRLLESLDLLKSTQRALSLDSNPNDVAMLLELDEDDGTLLQKASSYFDAYKRNLKTWRLQKDRDQRQIKVLEKLLAKKTRKLAKAQVKVHKKKQDHKEDVNVAKRLLREAQFQTTETLISRQHNDLKAQNVILNHQNQELIWEDQRLRDQFQNAKQEISYLRFHLDSMVKEKEMLYQQFQKTSEIFQKREAKGREKWEKENAQLRNTITTKAQKEMNVLHQLATLQEENNKLLTPSKTAPMSHEENQFWTDIGHLEDLLKEAGTGVLKRKIKEEEEDEKEEEEEEEEPATPPGSPTPSDELETPPTKRARWGFQPMF